MHLRRSILKSSIRQIRYEIPRVTVFILSFHLHYCWLHGRHAELTALLPHHSIPARPTWLVRSRDCSSATMALERGHDYSILLLLSAVAVFLAVGVLLRSRRRAAAPRATRGPGLGLLGQPRSYSSKALTRLAHPLLNETISEGFRDDSTSSSAEDRLAELPPLMEQHTEETATPPPTVIMSPFSPCDPLLLPCVVARPMQHPISRRRV